MISVPSILRNSRYRRDQRQMEEEEEMWFNEDEDFDETTAAVLCSSDEMAKNIDAGLDGISKMASAVETTKQTTETTNGPKINNNSTSPAKSAPSVLNNNANAAIPLPASQAAGDTKQMSLFKRVSLVRCFYDTSIIISFFIIIFSIFLTNYNSLWLIFECCSRVWWITKEAIRTKKMMKMVK